MKFICHVKRLSILLSLGLICESAPCQLWQNIGGNQTYSPGERGYYENLNEYSPKNCPSLNRYQYISWNVNNDSIYILENFSDYNEYNSHKAADVRFWVLNTQTYQWKCIVDRNNAAFVQGTKGIASPSNFPGPRVGAVTWVDADFNLWLFGGEQSYFSGGKYFCDLWKFDTKTQLWIWMSGEFQDLKPKTDPNTYASTGNYEALGIPSKTAFPSTRSSFAYASRSFNDNNGHLVLFGGDKSDDIWKYDIINNEWTWIRGKDPYYVSSFVFEYIDGLGTQPERTTPGTNRNAIQFWTDENNNYYMLNSNNEIWKLNLLTNYWEVVIKIGNGFLTEFGVEGDKGIYQKMTKPSSCKIGNYIYVFGGDEGNNVLTNSLFRLNLDNFKWTWLRGHTLLGSNNRYNLINNIGFVNVKNEERDINLPYSRLYPLMWLDKSGDIVIGYGSGKNANPYYDIWKYNVGNNKFSWIHGRVNDFGSYSSNSHHELKLNNVDTLTSFIVKDNIFSSQPTLNQIPVDNHVFIYQRNTIYKRNIETGITEVVKHFIDKIDGEEGQEGDDIYPKYVSVLGYDKNKIYFVDDKNYILYAHDLQTNKIKCLKKVSSPDDGIINVFSPSNFPNFENRNEPRCWFDNKGDLYMHGGYNKTDTWVYKPDLNQWAWVNGFIYGKSTNNENFPRNLRNMCTWVDNDKNLWVFGGHFSQSSGYVGSFHFNDMWKYDIDNNKWQLIRGANKFGISDANKLGYPGIKGIITYRNLPSSRSKYATWVDNNNNLWMMNGDRKGLPNLPNLGEIETLEDTWMFEPRIRRWVRVDGYDTPIKPYYSTYHKEYDFEKPYVRPVTQSTGDPFNSENTHSFTYNGKMYLIQYLTQTLWAFDFKPLTPQFVVFGGEARYDDDHNGCDESDPYFVNLKVSNDKINEFTFTNDVGEYYLYDQTLNFDVNAYFNKPYFKISPQDTTLSFNEFGQFVNLNYCVQPDGQKTDVSIGLIPASTAIPGFNTSYDIIYKNEGNQIASGEIQLNYDISKLKYISSTQDTIFKDFTYLTWKFEDLKPFEKRTISLILNVKSNTISGDSLTFTATITPIELDLDTLDNVFTHHQIITSSFDPNDKTIMEGTVLPIQKVGDYVNYLIRFENTGTASANFIILTDSIDKEKFDISSIVPVASSHNYNLEVRGNVMEILYEQINLGFPPDDKRYGYFLFKIKTKNNLTYGDEIRNVANIYFDYNLPITTNTSSAFFEDNSTSLMEKDISINTLFFPNPSNGKLYFSKEDISSIEIYNNSGSIIKEYLDIQNNIMSEIELDESLSGFYYFLVKYTNGDIKTHKIVITKTN